MPLTVTMYLKPDGHTRTVPIENVTDDDAAFFNDNNITVSIEAINDGQYALYADVGAEEELMYVSDYGMTCQEAMHMLRLRCDLLY